MNLTPLLPPHEIPESPAALREQAKDRLRREIGGKETSVYRLKGVVELKGVVFSNRIPPRVDVWKDCPLTLRTPIPGAVSFSYGYRHRLDMLSAARKHARAQGMDMATINLYVQPLSMTTDMQWDQLGKRDFGIVSLDGMPRAIADSLSLRWREWIVKDTGMKLAQVESRAAWNRPTDFISKFPAYIPRLLDEWRIQALTHLAYLTWSDKPLQVATLRPRGIDVAFAEPAVIEAFLDLAIDF